MKIIKNANLITMSEKYGNIENGYVKIQDHKIIEVGKMSDFSDSNIDAEIIEAEGRITTPGLVDAHSHLGMWEDGLDFEGDDGNEDTDPSTPQLRAVDAVNPQDRCFREALEAMHFAYVPYSGFTVGAALLTKSGKVYRGCNIENAAYGPSNCAERTAIFKAVSEGEREFAAIAVVGGKNGDASDIFPPCGVCRQVMQEFCAPDFMIYMGRSDGSYVAESLGAMLPYGFTAEKYMK